MAVKYRLIERKNLGNDKTETPKKQYAQVIYGDLVEFETFLEEVADGSGVGSAQVKAVLDRINIVLKRNLAQGRRVNVGELGNFRFGVGSTGAPTTEEFTTSLIKEPKVVFSPGKALRIAKKLANFEKRNSPNRKTEVAKTAKALTRSKISISIRSGFMLSIRKSTVLFPI